MKPITPAEARANKLLLIPDEVIETVNEMLAENYNDSGSIKIYQNQLIKRLLTKMPGVERNEVFSRRMLDFEDLFRNHGWDVSYDTPAFDENYEPHFVFTPSKA